MECAPWTLVPRGGRIKGQWGSMISSRTLGLVGEEIVDFAGRAIIRDDGETFVVHVQDQILAL